MHDVRVVDVEFKRQIEEALVRDAKRRKHMVDQNKTTSTILPVGDRVVVKPIEREEVTPSGIVIPDTAKEKPQEGTVVAIGPGKLTDNGDHLPMQVHAGDRILFAKFGGTEFVLEGEELLVLRESDILAIVMVGDKIQPRM